MRKHLGTILGVVLTLVVAGGVFIWDFSRRDESSFHRAGVLFERCYDVRRAATGAGGSQDFPECNEFHRAHFQGQSERTTAAAMVGGGAGFVFALLFFGIRRFRGRGEASD